MDSPSYFWYYLIIFSLLVILILYGLFEVHYFLRMCLSVFMARFVKRKCHILETTTMSGLCLTNDVDTLLYHMNNARYLRELDFARVDFYERTNLYRMIIDKGGSVFQGASTIRYRRFIRPFRRFMIASRIIYWDNQSIYMEHQFLRPSDNFVHAIAICKQRIINCSAEDVMSQLIGKQVQSAQFEILNAATNVETSELGPNNGTVAANSNTTLEDVENGGPVLVKFKPDVPPDILKWIEYNDLSSKNLRKGC